MAETAKTVISLLELAERAYNDDGAAICGAVMAVLGFLIGIPVFLANSTYAENGSIGFCTFCAVGGIAACAVVGCLLYRIWIRIRWIMPLRIRLRRALDTSTSPWDVIQLAQRDRIRLLERVRPLYGIGNLLDSYKPFDVDDVVC